MDIDQQIEAVEAQIKARTRLHESLTAVIRQAIREREIEKLKGFRACRKRVRNEIRSLRAQLKVLHDRLAVAEADARCVG